MSRKKRKNTPLTASTPMRPAASNHASRLLMIVAMIPLAVGIYLFVAGNTAAPEPRNHTRPTRRAPEASAPTKVAPIEETVEAHAEMNRDFELWFDIAEEVAGDDVQAHRLIAFARARSIPSMVQNGGITVFLIMGDDVEAAIARQGELHTAPSLAMPRAFEITVADMATRRSYGMRALSDWQYDQGRNELFVPPRRGYSRAYGAIVLLHELQHAYDLCTGAEPETPTREEWALGESRAYAVELRLVDRITNGEASRFARSLVERYRPAGRNWIWIADMANLHADLAEWDRIIGEAAMNDGELSARGGTLLMLMNRELVRREGLTDTDFLQFIDETRSHT